MAGEVTQTQASGMFMKVYDKKVRDLRPSSAIIQKELGFNSQQKVGESYNVSVVLRPPNGFTYAGTSGGVVQLKQARNMVQKQATLTPYEIDLREQIAYAVFSRAVGDEGSFKAATGEIVAGMQLAASNRLEASLLHGQRGYGTVESISDNGDGTMNVVITQATWAPGMWWAIGEGSTWDAFTGTTKNNGTAALVLQSVTASSRTLKVTFSGTAGSEVAAGDVLYPEGAYDGTTHADMPGLLAQASNTSGTSLGLSATTYSNWAANTYAVGGPINHFVIEDALSVLRDRGASGKLGVYVSNKAFSVLSMELSQLRIIDSSYNKSKGSAGQQAVSYFSAELGEVSITAHPFMKQGEFLVLPIEGDTTERVGSSDITFELPGRKQEFVRFLENYNAVELQNFSDQAVICKRPNHSMLGTGITYPT